MASKEKEHNARKLMARWWYDVNVPLNGATSYYYQPMIDAISSMEPDGWSNRRNVPIVNFLAYSPRGTIFLKSVDTSGLRKDKETLFEMFDEVVKEVGQENIVQFVSDNDFAFKATGKTLQQRYDTFFWSPCALHCIDLIIQCLLKFKKELQQMFTCMKWVESSHGKSKVGKEITAIILQDKDFWPRCEHIVKVSESLMRVLRLEDNEEKLAIGYLYEAMDKEKEPSRQG
ncbi:hypothetical protein NC651_028159 [Populus alba x Populus x berolinensis]|nr:hypothetical protein NC651_028159 [Populus alba x Populus x berolinensis]